MREQWVLGPSSHAARAAHSCTAKPSPSAKGRLEPQGATLKMSASAGPAGFPTQHRPQLQEINADGCLATHDRLRPRAAAPQSTDVS